ncbi:MAG: hypothetical protein ABL962_10995 [Fimbriimonadaceae bacterium]
MVDFRRPFYWAAAVVFYWLLTLWLFFRTFPVYEDGYGAMPSFYWNATRAYPGYLYPYWLATSIITAIGCSWATVMARFCKSRFSHVFWAAFGVTLFSLLLLVVISNLGAEYRLWRAPRLSWDISNLISLLKAMIPISLVAGLFALGATAQPGIREPRS